MGAITIEPCLYHTDSVLFYMSSESFQYPNFILIIHTCYLTFPKVLNGLFVTGSIPVTVVALFTVYKWNGPGNACYCINCICTTG